MSKVRFEVARQYIQDGEYDKAREVLKSLDHPAASKWLNQLDELDPPFPNIQLSHRKRPSSQVVDPRLSDGEIRYIKHKTELHRTGRSMSMVILGLMSFCGIVYFIVYFLSLSDPQQPRGPVAFCTGPAQMLVILTITLLGFLHVKNLDF